MTTAKPNMVLKKIFPVSFQSLGLWLVLLIALSVWPEDRAGADETKPDQPERATWSTISENPVEESAPISAWGRENHGGRVYILHKNHGGRVYILQRIMGVVSTFFTDCFII